jgi:hypothetical protein
VIALLEARKPKSNHDELAVRGQHCTRTERRAEAAERELIKIKLLETAPGDRHELAEQLAKDCRAALVQVIGRNLLLYRPRPLTDPRPSLEMELA